MLDQDTKNILAEANQVIEELTGKLSQKNSDKSKNEMIKEISIGVMKQLTPFIKGSSELIEIIKDFEKNPQVISKKEMIDALKEAMKETKFEPTFQIPEIKIPEINIPDVIIPQIKVPQAIVNVSPPEVNMPEIKIPKEMKVTGFSGFIKELLATIKGGVEVVLSEVNQKNPLPVILTDDNGEFYKPAGGGGVVVAGGASARVVEVSNLGRGVTPTIGNVSMASNAVIYSTNLPPNVTGIDIKLRDIGATLKVGWDSALATYVTIPAGGAFHIGDVLFATAKTVYFQSDTDTQVVEIQSFIK